MLGSRFSLSLLTLAAIDAYLGILYNFSGAVGLA